MKISNHGKPVLWRAKSRDGAKAIIIYGRKVLLLKRRNLPFIINPGIWSFVGGRREEGETYLETACREIFEETGIRHSDLKLVLGQKMMELRDIKRNGYIWKNAIFLFRSRSQKVKINIENAGYRWASVRELEDEKDFTNEFVRKKKILRMIKLAIGR